MSEPLSDRYMERISIVACCLVVAAASSCSGASPSPHVYDVALARTDDANVAPVYLRLVGPDSAVLERAVEDGWEDVCSRCNGYVPAFGPYRVRLADGRETKPFKMSGLPGTDVVLTVDSEAALTQDVDEPKGTAAAATGAALLLRFFLLGRP